MAAEAIPAVEVAEMSVAQGFGAASEAKFRPCEVSATAEPRKRMGWAFGPRFFLLLGVGLVAVGPAFWNAHFLWAMPAWDLLVLGLWLWDLLRLPAAQQIETRRSWPAAVTHGCVQTVTLTVTNASGRAVRLRLIDEAAPELRLEPATGAVEMGRGAATFAYRIRPRRRGDVEMGGVALTCQSPLRLAERWMHADLRQTVRVLPNLEAARLHSLYLLRGRSLHQERRRVHRIGRGRELESLRDYRSGDEYRDICWTATARRLKPVTRTWQMERNQTVWMVLDTGRLLRARAVDEAGEPTDRLLDGGEDAAVPPIERTRLDDSVDAALTLAQVALHSGDQVGLLAYGRGLSARVLPGRGVTQMQAIIQQLSLVQPEALEADHLFACARLQQMQRRRSLIVWITDLAETAMTPEVIEAAARLQGRHLVLFVAMGQTELMRLAQQRPETVEAMYRVTAAQEILLRREQLLGQLASTGVLALQTAPSGLSTLLLHQYLELKERGKL